MPFHQDFNVTHYLVHVDGGARGNPGPAAIGVVIRAIGARGTNLLTRFGRKIGETTNNVAEYQAVIQALSWFRDHSYPRAPIEVILDSALVVNQLNGTYKVKDAKLRELLIEVRVVEQQIGFPVHYVRVGRTQNADADALVNEALDLPAGR